MDELMKKLTETDNAGWTVIDENTAPPAEESKRMLLDGDAEIDPRKENENTIAAIGQLPDCAVLIITKEGNLAALNAATELYASVKHFGHSAEFLLLRGSEAEAEALSETCKEIVLNWRKDQQ